MNLYLRYFDFETLVYSVDEALDFLASIPEIGLDDELANDIREYVASDNVYPKRYKLRPRVYFIIIKTTAETMQDFKDKKAVKSLKKEDEKTSAPSAHTPQMSLVEVRQGWYQGNLDFKRVVLVPATGKCEYRDTHVEYQCKAMSGIDCYERIIAYLRTRVDNRSQFPSAKGKNFQFSYLGMWK